MPPTFHTPLCQVFRRRYGVQQTAKLIAGAVCAGLLLATPMVSAQQRDGGGGRAARAMFGGLGGFGGSGGQSASINDRQIEKITEQLSLDQTQIEAIKALQAGYDAQMRELREQTQQLMTDAREQMRDGDRSAFEGVRESMQEISIAQKAAEVEFIDNVQLLLNESQFSQWNSVDRMLRRERTMRQGLMSGERLNVFALVEELELTDDVDNEVRGVLSDYDLALDRELVRRNDYQAEARDAMRELFQSRDVEAADAMIAEGRRYSIGVREVNRKYARIVSELLPENVRTSFDRSVQRANFPDVYRQTRIDRSFDAVLGFADLDDEQRESIQDLRATFGRRVSDVNTQLAKLTEEREMNFSMSDIMQRMGNRGGNRGRGNQGNNDDDPMGKLRNEKRELGTSTQESLKKLLTEEQIARLPEDEERGRNADRQQRGQRDGRQGQQQDGQRQRRGRF